MSERPTPPIRVLLVDDHRIALWGLEKLIESKKSLMEVVGSATNCTEALDLVNKVSPDVIVLNLDLGEKNGFDAILGLITTTKARVLVLTGSRDPSNHEDAVLAGARGIVKKEEPVETILKAIEKIHAGHLRRDHSTAGRIFVALSRKSAAEKADPERRKISTLTPKEIALVRAIATNPEANSKTLANMLQIGESTVHNRLTTIYVKLGVANKLGLFAVALKHGLDKPPA